ncbi:MAG: serine hydrolase [Candidatus Bathyarchaeota archaeon]|nr:MAG: serine hydrolase [Candidatus Bathyarchaeota archaeon]
MSDVTSHDFSYVFEDLDIEIESTMNQRELCGLTIAFIEGDNIVWSKGYGYTDRAKGEWVTPHTLFSTQSMGKTFTATAFMIMASRGQLDLDDPIRKHYPEFTVNTRGDPDTEINRITFRRMLSHWAGFPHEATRGNNYDDTPHTYKEHIESIKDNWLRTTPGTEYSYSNIGYDLTAYIMGRIIGMIYPQAMRETLFKPLGIKTATYNILEAQRNPFAKGHIGDFQTPTVQVPMLGAGGVYISAVEVAKLVSFHLAKGKVNGEQLIKPELFDEMYREQYPELASTNYGLGLECFKLKGITAYGHGGGGYGYDTVMAWIPGHNIGIVVLSNDQNRSTSYEIGTKAMELMVNTIKQSREKHLKPERLKKLEGTYKAPRQPLIRIAYDDGALHLYDTNNNEKHLTPENPLEYTSDDGTRITFKLEDDHPATLRVESPSASFTARINDSPHEPKGPDKPEWDKHLGTYQYQYYGRTAYLTLTKIDGHLHIIEQTYPLKLTHHRDDVYFDAEGEALILKQDSLTYAGMHATKVDLTIESLIHSYTADPAMFRASRNIALRHIIHTYYRDGLQQAFNLLEALQQLIKAPVNGYNTLGRTLHTHGRYQDAKTCYQKTLEQDPKNKQAKLGILKLERLL